MAVNQVLKLQYAFPSQVARTGLSVLPTVDRGVGDTHELSELGLRQPPDFPSAPYALGIVARQVFGNEC